MSKLKEEELLNHLADLYTLYFAVLFDPRPEVQEFLIDDNQPERQKHIDKLEEGKRQAYQQIVALIKKPKVTEEWIHEKQKAWTDGYWRLGDARNTIKLFEYTQNFIRSLVVEVVEK